MGLTSSVSDPMPKDLQMRTWRKVTVNEALSIGRVDTSSFFRSRSCQKLQLSFLDICRFLLSQRPEVEANVALELDRAGLLVTPERPTPRSFVLTDMQKLPYFNNVCKA